MCLLPSKKKRYAFTNLVTSSFRVGPPAYFSLPGPRVLPSLVGCSLNPRWLFPALPVSAVRVRSLLALLDGPPLWLSLLAWLDPLLVYVAPFCANLRFPSAARLPRWLVVALRLVFFLAGSSLELAVPLLEHLPLSPSLLISGPLLLLRLIKLLLAFENATFRVTQNGLKINTWYQKWHRISLTYHKVWKNR